MIFLIYLLANSQHQTTNIKHTIITASASPIDKNNIDYIEKKYTKLYN